MKKKILPILIITLVVTLINTGLLLFLVFGGVNMANFKKPVVISRDYDKGQSYELAKETNKPVILWFYTDWCAYCQKFAPTFKKLTKKKDIKQNFAVAYVNCEDKVNEPLVKEFNVKGFPTVYLLDAANNKKELINPMHFFMPNAVEKLQEEFLEFLNKSE